MSLNYSRSYNEKIFDWILKVKKKAETLAQSKLMGASNCPVCNLSDTYHFVNNDSLDYVKCSNCEVVYMNPRPLDSEVNDGFQGQDSLLMEYFDIIKDGFNIHEAVKVDPANDNQLKDIFKFKKNGLLLDVGCSVGKFLNKASTIFDVEGVEINPITAEIAKRKFKVHTDFLDKLNLEKKYDVITLNQILYGVPSPVSLLRDIHKILKDDGILYINTPNSGSHAIKLFGGKANHFYGYTTLNVFNPSALEKLAVLAGFKVKFLKTEWYDVYTSDVKEFLTNKESFIHKRNIHLPNYEEMMKAEDATIFPMLGDLGESGNYIAAILEKC